MGYHQIFKFGVAKDEKQNLYKNLLKLHMPNKRKVTFKTKGSDRNMQRELKAFIF